MTGRDKVLMFDGSTRYLEEGLVEVGSDGSRGRRAGGGQDMVEATVLVPFNDPEALGTALDRRDIAVVLTEPALTNNYGLILPDPGFHETLRRLTREAGRLLALDETHTQVVGPGGLSGSGASTRSHHLGEVHRRGGALRRLGDDRRDRGVLTQAKGRDGERFDLVATGGTLFGNALSMAAARATMLET